MLSGCVGASHLLISMLKLVFSKRKQKCCQCCRGWGTSGQGGLGRGRRGREGTIFMSFSEEY